MGKREGCSSLDFLRKLTARDKTVGASSTTNRLAKSVTGKPVGFVLLAFVIGATISQGSFAFADDSNTNPFRAIWEAIGELQVKTDSLQAQIDDLKSQQVASTASAVTVAKVSDSSLVMDVAGGESGQMLVTLAARNSGPDNAVGTKLTAFYQRSVLQVNFIEGADCTDGTRGIIECYLGTIAPGSERRIVIDASPVVLDAQTIITAEISSITRDTTPVDNRAEVVFVTFIGSIAPPVPAPAPAPVQQEPEQVAPVEQEQQEGPIDSEESTTSEEGEDAGQSGDQESPQVEQQETVSPGGEDAGSEEQTGDQSEQTNDSGESAPDQGAGAESGSENSTGGGSQAGSTGSEGQTSDDGSGESNGSSAQESSDNGDASSGSNTGDAGGDSGDTGSDGGSSEG